MQHTQRQTTTKPRQPELLELPTDIDAEKAVLGSILLNREAILAIKDWLKPERFYLARHTQIYEAALSLVAQGTPPDTRTLASELKVRNQLEAIGGLLYLTELVEGVPSSYHIAHYAAQVDRSGYLRELIRAGGQITAAAYNCQGDADVATGEVTEIFQGVMGRRHHGPAPRTESINELWAKSFDPPVWVIEGLLLEGLTIFSGKPKMGKGLVVTNLAAAVASGGKALGVAQAMQGDVLYLALEDPEAELQTRFERALGGRPNVPLSYRTSWRPLASGGLVDLSRWLDEHPAARLIVVDTFSAVAPIEDGKKSAYASDYTALRPLQQLASSRPGLAIIAVTHSRKAGADDVLDEMSGTTGKQGAVDHVWVMRRKRGENVGELHAELRRAASWAKQILFDPILATWRLGQDAEAAKADTIRDDILEALNDGEAWPKDLSELIDGDRAQVRKQLGILKRQGLIETGDRGRYRLTSAGRHQIQKTSDPVDQGIRGSDLTNEKPHISRPKNDWRDWDAESDEVSESPAEAQAGIEGLIPDQTSVTSPDPDQTSVDRLLRNVPPRERIYISLYVRSNKASDQATGRAKCEENGIDYAALYLAMHGSRPGEAGEV